MIAALDLCRVGDHFGRIVKQPPLPVFRHGIGDVLAT